MRMEDNIATEKEYETAKSLHKRKTSEEIRQE